MHLIDCDRTRGAEILAILNEAIVNSTSVYEYRPRTMAMMDAWFDVKGRGNYPVIGAIDDEGRLLGFATYGMFRERTLLRALIERARAQDYHVLVGGIDADNAVSIELHKEFGFTFCGEIREAGFKFGRWLHLVFYQLILDTPVRPVDG